MNEPIISPWLFYLGYLSKVINILPVFAIIVVWYNMCNYKEASDSLECAKDKRRWALHYLKMRRNDYRENTSSISYKNLYDNSLSSYDEAAQDEEDAKRLLEISISKCRKTIVVVLALLTVWAIVPNETTIYRMALAKVITPHNLQITSENIESIIDKAVDKIIKIKEAK